MPWFSLDFTVSLLLLLGLGFGLYFSLDFGSSVKLVGVSIFNHLEVEMNQDSTFWHYLRTGLVGASSIWVKRHLINDFITKYTTDIR